MYRLRVHKKMNETDTKVHLRKELVFYRERAEHLTTAIDLLQKSYFYLSAAKDCKLTIDHCKNIGVLCDLIDAYFEKLSK